MNPFLSPETKVSAFRHGMLARQRALLPLTQLRAQIGCLPLYVGSLETAAEVEELVARLEADLGKLQSLLEEVERDAEATLVRSFTGMGKRRSRDEGV